MQTRSKRTFPITVQSWGWSHQGNTRKENQDSFLNWADHLLWAVADGVGGASNGGEASRYLIRSLLEVPTPTSLQTHIESATSQIGHANELFHQHKVNHGEMVASTVVALLLYDGMGCCLWAGDSRCYLLRNGVLYQCTKDHTLRQEKVDKGELSPQEAKLMVKGNIITNAIGAKKNLHLAETRFSVRAGDRFLLSTDGLTNLLSPEALAIYLDRPTTKEATEAIVEALEDMHQPDNITFITIFLSHPE